VCQADCLEEPRGERSISRLSKRCARATAVFERQQGSSGNPGGGRWKGVGEVRGPRNLAQRDATLMKRDEVTAAAAADEMSSFPRRCLFMITISCYATPRGARGVGGGGG